MQRNATDMAANSASATSTVNVVMILNVLVFALFVCAWGRSMLRRGFRQATQLKCPKGNAEDDDCEEEALEGSHRATSDPAATDFVDEELERIGVGRFHWRVLVATWLGWMADGAENEVVAFVLPSLQEQWGVLEADFGTLSSLSSGAMAVSALASGRIADTWGRRPVFVLSCLIIALGSLGSAAAPNWMVFVAVRIFGNVGVGALLCVDVPLMSEFMPASRRNSYLSILHFGFSMGALWVRLMAWMCFGAGDRAHWRGFVVLCGVPVVLAFLSRSQLSETPHALVKMGRVDEARAVLADIARINGVPTDSTVCEVDEVELGKRGSEYELADMTALAEARQPTPSEETLERPIESVIADGDHERKHVRKTSTQMAQSPTPPVSPKRLWCRTFWVAALTFGMQAGSAMAIWVSDIAKHYDALGPEFYATMTVGAVMVQFVHIFSFFLFSTRVVAWDVLIVGTFGCYAMLAGIIQSLLAEQISFNLTAVFLILWNFPFSLSWGALYCAIVSDFPAAHRATVVGVVDAASRVCAVIHPVAAAHFLVTVGPALTTFVFSQGWFFATAVAICLRISM